MEENMDVVGAEAPSAQLLTQPAGVGRQDFEHRVEVLHP
jgi:hypothetical protein